MNLEDCLRKPVASAVKDAMEWLNNLPGQSILATQSINSVTEKVLRAVRSHIKVNAQFRTVSDHLTGTMAVDVDRVEWEDDGELMVSLNYWPKPDISYDLNVATYSRDMHKTAYDALLDELKWVLKEKDAGTLEINPLGMTLAGAARKVVELLRQRVKEHEVQIMTQCADLDIIRAKSDVVVSDLEAVRFCMKKLEEGVKRAGFETIIYSDGTVSLKRVGPVPVGPDHAKALSEVVDLTGRLQQAETENNELTLKLAEAEGRNTELNTRLATCERPLSVVPDKVIGTEIGWTLRAEDGSYLRVRSSEMPLIVAEDEETAQANNPSFVPRQIKVVAFDITPDDLK